MRFTLAAGLCAIAIVSGTEARSHEFWIDPVAPLSAPGEIRTDLRVGAFFKGDAFPYLSDRFNFFRVSVRGQTFDVKGNEGDLPAVSLTEARPGLNVISFFGKPNRVVFDDFGTFAIYLKTEGLDWVFAAHEARGLPRTGFAEAFSRTVKTLVQVGPALPSDTDIAVGMPLELVAGVNPYADPALQALPVTLLWQGKPLPDAQLSVFQDNGAVVRTTLRTDAKGGAILDLKDGGRFLVNAVHIQEASPDLDAAWESHWASLTFALEQR